MCVCMVFLGVMGVSPLDTTGKEAGSSDIAVLGAFALPCITSPPPS